MSDYWLGKLVVRLLKHGSFQDAGVDFRSRIPKTHTTSGVASWGARESRERKSSLHIFPSHVALGVGRCDVARCPLFSAGAVES